MKFKKFLFSLLFNAHERELIKDALTFSANTYKRRSDYESASTVQTVLDDHKELFD